MIIQKDVLLARGSHSEGHVEVVNEHRGEEDEADISVVCWQSQRCGGHLGHSIKFSVALLVAIEL